MLIQSRFKPAWWLKNAHLQTTWPVLMRNIRSPANHRETLATPDNDFVDLDWYTQGRGPIVMLLHGLTGSSQSSYIKGLQIALLQRGLRSVALNFRGCSGRPNNSARAYHSGETSDISLLYQHLRRQEPDTPLAAVGFSLGGNALLKWLGEEGKALSLFAAVSVSVPFVLSNCADVMDTGLSRIYRNRLLNDLNCYMKSKCEHLVRTGRHDEAGKLIALGDLSPIRSFWDYDQRVITRLYAFRDAHDYYRKSSSRQYLRHIAIPTLMIQARDDPFVSLDVLPMENELSPVSFLEITKHGGHVGFISGSVPGRPQYWLDQRIPEFLQNRLQQLQS